MTDRRKTPVDPFTHDATRPNIPTPELEPVMEEADKAPIRVEIARRDPDLDPQLVWRGKADGATLSLDAPPLYLQEQIHPKALIEDLRRNGANGQSADLFDHFGLTDEDAEAAVEFYRHPTRWSNRMILGDALQVMGSLAEREGLRGRVQAIYIDPPYGIRFNSNFQWSTTSRDVKDGKLEHLTREPEQVKAFRDTWRDGIHSYLSYLRDRLVVARELLAESGSCFVQIGDENVHRVRALMDEVFGEANFVSEITYRTTTGKASAALDSTRDFIIWFAKDLGSLKFRRLMFKRAVDADANFRFDFLPDGRFVPLDGAAERIARMNPITSQSASSTTLFEQALQGKKFRPGKGGWKTNSVGMSRLLFASRLTYSGKTMGFVRPFDDYGFQGYNDIWDDTRQSGFGDEKRYIVQTAVRVVERCLLMTTDPGDLVLDPTCGSGTTAHVAEQWGRRWITIDTSRVALALARARIMGAKYPWYLLKDSPEGQRKEAEVTRSSPATHATYDDIRHGFVYHRVPHITLKSIANNTEIDAIWERMQPAVEAARAALNTALAGHPTPFAVETGGRKGQRIDFTASGEVELPSGEAAPAAGFMEWEIPREAPEDWPEAARAALAQFWRARIARQTEIDASIAARAEHEYLYDKPYEDRKRIRVAGPFTVESLSPHRIPAVDADGELIEARDAATGARRRGADEAGTYLQAMFENLKSAGVQQPHKGDAIRFTALTPWPGERIAAEGVYMEGEAERRAGVFIGPEYGTVQRADLVAAAREAADAGFDILIACAFNFEAHTAELRRLGRVPILQARMNADLHMAGDLKAGGGNLFVVFGEPDIALEEDGDRLRLRLLGVDIFRPATGEVVSTEADDIACWFIDTDYNEESFFVRHAYFPGTELPYKALKSTLKAEIDAEAWDSLKRTRSRWFPRPASGRIAVKVINHLGDEVMKVMGV